MKVDGSVSFPRLFESVCFFFFLFAGHECTKLVRGRRVFWGEERIGALLSRGSFFSDFFGTDWQFLGSFVGSAYLLYN